MIKIVNRVLVVLIFSFTIVLGRSDAATDYFCEVMSIQGTATSIRDGITTPLKEGDILKAGTVVKVETNSSIDLAYDRDWENISRIQEKSEVALSSIYPATHLDMKYGDIFSKLKKLPKNSEFQVKTPSAVAVVRGSAYRTIHRDGETIVQNAHESSVYVYGLDLSGKIADNPVTIHNAEKIEMVGAATMTQMPQKMSEAEIAQCASLDNGIQKQIASFETQGRVGKIQSVDQMEAPGPNGPPPGGGPGGPNSGESGGPGGNNYYATPSAYPTPPPPINMPPPPAFTPPPVPDITNTIDNVTNTVTNNIDSTVYASQQKMQCLAEHPDHPEICN